MKIIKTSNYIKKSFMHAPQVKEFTDEEIMDIGWRLLDWENTDEETGQAKTLHPGKNNPFTGDVDNNDSDYNNINENNINNFVETQAISTLGKTFVGNRGALETYCPDEEEMGAAIEELKNIISISGTFVEPIDINEIKILITQLEQLLLYMRAHNFNFGDEINENN